MLILEPDQAQAKRLGDAWVMAANLVGLAVGGGVAAVLIAALTG
jgi:hypothetical protein